MDKLLQLYACVNKSFFHLKRVNLQAAQNIPVTEEVEADYLTKGIFYGFIATIIIINIAFYKIFNEKKLILFTALLSALALSIAHEDGLLSMVLSINLLVYTKILSHLCIGIITTILAIHVAGISKPLTVACRAVNALVAGLFIITAFTARPLYMYIGNIILFSCLTLLLLFEISKVRNSYNTRYLLMSCLPLCILLIIVFVFTPSGGAVQSISTLLLKPAMLILVSVFMAGVMQRVYKLQKEHLVNNLMVHNAVHEKAESIDEPTDNNKDEHFNHIAALYGLTESELKVFKCIARGMTNAEISEKLFISVNTVKYHNRNIFEKLDINSKSQAISKILSMQVNSN